MSHQPSITGPHPGDAIIALTKVIAAFRSKSAEFPMQWAAVLLAVAHRPGVSATELRARLSMSPAALSRTVHALAEKHPSGAEGLGLIKSVTDPGDTRRQQLYLTEVGAGFIAELSGYLGAGGGRAQVRPSRLRGVVSSPFE